MSTYTREWIGVGRHRVGRTSGGQVVIVTAELTYQGRTWDHQTVTHDTLPDSDPACLALQGEAWQATLSGNVDRRRADCDAAGQIGDMLRQVTDPAPGWTLTEVRELADIWDRWHLNTMRAACAHMDPETLAREDDSYGGTRIACGAANTCEVSGYTYGSAWLVEPLPADVLARVTVLMRDRSADLYAARGYDGAGKVYPGAGAR